MQSSADPSTPPVHPRDISPEDLQIALAAQTDEILPQLVQLSRDAFGFYTSHFPHTINYPWIVRGLAHLPSGSHLLDIGSGVSPVPLFLARKNHLVDCVDYSQHVRRLPVLPNWNEWGFFDYSSLDANLASYNCDVTKFAPSHQYDAIYSIASLAHMPRSIREEALRRCFEWLRPDGVLLLAIDVIPASDFIWNRSEGREVEPLILHSTIRSITDRLTQLGFHLDVCEVKRTVFKSRTDLLFIAARKPSPNESH